MRRSVVRGAAGGVAALGVALSAQVAGASNGLESPEAGAYQVGRGGAWLARADDPLAVYFNPAGLVRQATGVHLGAHLMFLDRCYARKGKESNESSEAYGQDNQPVSPGRNFAGPGADPEGPEVGPPELTCAKTTPYPNPQIAANFRLHERVAVGVGLIGPHGVGNVEWPEELPFVNSAGSDKATQPAPQRYMLVKSESLIFFPTLSAAFAVTPELSVGAGFTWGVAIAQFENFSEAFSEAPSKANNCGPNGDRACVARDDFRRDVRSKLTATDVFVPGFVVGALWSPSRFIDLAGWFRWSDAIDTDASVSTESNYWEPTGKKAEGEKCSDPKNQDCTITLGEKEGDPGYNAGRLKLNIPMEAKLGVRFHWPRQDPGPRPKWAQGKTVRDPMSEDLFDVEANFTYANNSSVQSVEVRFRPGININGTPGQLPQNADIPHNWRDVFGVRLGGEYVVLPSLLSLRAGGFYESSGQDPRYLNLDFHLSERVGLSGGASVRLGPVDVTVAYQHTFFGVTDNGGRGALYGLSGDASTGEDPNKPGGAFRTYQPVNGGQLKSELNEVALGGTLRF